jgi:hypothetical protein
MRYKAILPFIPDMGSVDPVSTSDKPSESKQAETLWHLNRMRDHDGLRPLVRLPKGTKFEPCNRG